MKYSIVTFGCRVNQADSFQIEEQLMAAGGAAARHADADLVVVNTCSVTSAADQGTRQIVRKIARENPGARIVVTGCYATRRPERSPAFPASSRLFPTIAKSISPHEIGLDDRASGSAMATARAAPRSRPAWPAAPPYTLRVQTGCDQACSYCIIPSTRGAGRSRPLTTCCRRSTASTRAGYREIAITGVHLGSYGRDLGDGSSLLELAEG